MVSLVRGRLCVGVTVSEGVGGVEQCAGGLGRLGVWGGAARALWGAGPHWMQLPCTGFQLHLMMMTTCLVHWMHAGRAARRPAAQEREAGGQPDGRNPGAWLGTARGPHACTSRNPPFLLLVKMTEISQKLTD